MPRWRLPGGKRDVFGGAPDRFHVRHWQLDSDALEGAPVEIITLRVRAAGRVCRFALPRSRAPRARPADRRPVIFPGTGLVECEHLDPMRSGRAR